MMASGPRISDFNYFDVLEMAKNNNVFRLKTYLNKFEDVELKSEMINSRIDGTTPLLIACRNSNVDMVVFLIKECKADVELTGSVVFDGDTIEGTPPLWCAAAIGNSEIVRILIKYGANVNSITNTRSTPLRAACFDGHLDVVKYLVEKNADIEIANRHGHTCLMIACYKGHYEIAKYLLSINADVNRKSTKGNTALHDCAESGHLNILKLLLHHGAKMDVDSYGMTPLLAASCMGHYLIVNYLLNYCGKMDREKVVDALELLGATYVDKKRNIHAAIDVWKKAMKIRYEEGRPPMIKNITAEKVAAYEFAEEAKHPDELNDLSADPDKMRIQALLVRERILGPAHPDTCYYIRYRGACYADTGQFDRCMELWNYALDMQQRILDPLHTMTLGSFFSFAELFSVMIRDDDTRNCNRKIPLLRYSDIKLILERAVTEIKGGLKLRVKNESFDETRLLRILSLTLHLSAILAKLLPQLSKNESHEAHCLMYSLVSLKIKLQNGSSLLHLASSNKHSLISRHAPCTFPSTKLISFLCRVGADVNNRDNDGNTPLHLIAGFNRLKIVKVLLEYGAHFDNANNEGKTYTDLSKGKLSSTMNYVKLTSLRCLSARIVKKNSIPYKGSVPVTLYSFIEDH